MVCIRWRLRQGRYARAPRRASRPRGTVLLRQQLLILSTRAWRLTILQLRASAVERRQKQHGIGTVDERIRKPSRQGLHITIAGNVGVVLVADDDELEGVAVSLLPLAAHERSLRHILDAR